MTSPSDTIRNAALEEAANAGIHRESAEALRALQSAPAAEPVAWQYRYESVRSGTETEWIQCSREVFDRIKSTGNVGPYLAETRPLYAAPQPVACPEGWRDVARCPFCRSADIGKKVIGHPPNERPSAAMICTACNSQWIDRTSPSFENSASPKSGDGK